MKLFLNIFLLIFFFICPVSLNADNHIVSTQEIAVEFLNLLQNDQFKQAALLFHYPDIYSQKKRESEFKSVKKGLKRHKEKFGKIIKILKKIPDAEYLGSGVSGAEIDYWRQQKGASPSIIFPCVFEKIHFGVIRVTFCKIRDKYEIQSVDFSFINNNDTKEQKKGLIN